MIEWENDLSSYQEKSIAATFNCQLQNLEVRFPDASNLLKILAYLDPESISLDMLQAAAVSVSKSFVPTPSSPPKKRPLLHRMRNKLQGMGMGKTRPDKSESALLASPRMTAVLDLIQSPTNLQIALIQPQNRSLIKRHQTDGCSSLWIHDLIQLLVLDNARKCGGEKEFFECAVELICTAFQQIDDPESPTSWQQYEIYISHIQALTTRDKISDRARDNLIAKNGKVARYLCARGRYNDAQTLGERLLSQQIQSCGSEHIDVLTTMHNLASVYSSQGRYADAENMYNRVLRSLEQQLGSDHVDVLTTMHNLAIVYSSQGRYAEAEKLYNRVLRSREQQLGSDHVQVLTTMHNLAVVYSSQGRYTEAEKLFNRVLRSREQQLGSDHVDVLTTMHNLAIVYSSQGRYAEAEKLYNRVLRSQEQQLGSDHVGVLTTVHNLAGVYESQSRYAEAEKLYNRVLRSVEQRLGSDHVDVLATKQRLASVSMRKR